MTERNSFPRLLATSESLGTKKISISVFLSRLLSYILDLDLFMFSLSRHFKL